METGTGQALKAIGKEENKNLFLLVAILLQALLTLVGRHLMTFTFFTARHNALL